MNVICFGDSNTFGYDPRSFFGDRYDADSRWVDILAGKTGWNVVNWGENGRQIPKYSVSFPENTDLLIVMLGTNDLLQGYSAEQTAGKMERLLSGATMTRKNILLIAPPPMVRGAWVPNQEIIDRSLALCLYYQDLAEPLGIRFANAGEWGVALSFDGVHFSEEGHSVFAKRLINTLKVYSFL